MSEFEAAQAVVRRNAAAQVAAASAAVLPSTPSSQTSPYFAASTLSTGGTSSSGQAQRVQPSAITQPRSPGFEEFEPFDEYWSEIGDMDDAAGQQRQQQHRRGGSSVGVSLAEAARAMRLLLDTAAEVSAEAAAAAAAAEAAVEAAAAEKAKRIEAQAFEAEALAPAGSREVTRGAGDAESGAGGARGRSGTSGGRRGKSRVGKWLRRLGGGGSGGLKSPSDVVHPTKSCMICLDMLGTEGGVQALGCMDCFCRECIATHIATRVKLKHDVTCPMCQRPIPEEEQEEVGPPPKPPPKPSPPKPPPTPQSSSAVQQTAAPTTAAGNRGTGRPSPAARSSANPPSTAGDEALARALAASDAAEAAADRRGASRPPAREWLAGLAIAAVNAPALLRAGPAALEAAAHRLRGRSGGRREDDPDWVDPDFDDDDFVVMEDGSYLHLGS